MGMGRKWAFSVGDGAREEGNSSSKTLVKKRKEHRDTPKWTRLMSQFSPSGDEVHFIPAPQVLIPPKNRWKTVGHGRTLWSFLAY